LNQFETTLPPTVRISSVRPRVERDGTMRVEVVVLARTVEAVDAFIENLEKRGAFSGVLSREEFLNEDGLIQASLEGRYRAAAPAAAKEGRP
jgi:Tfp pilus assembly protein PilN